MHVPRRYRAALVAVVTTAALSAAPVHAADKGTMTAYTYRNAAGSLPYKVYTPPSGAPHATTLVVVLPGAGETSDGAALHSGWDLVADRFHVVIAYPQQNPAYSSTLEWDWAKASTDGRTGREASLVAGLTRLVVARNHLDPRRVFVTGMSAGAGMAGAMAVLFPDVYHGLGIEAGCPFDGTRCAGSSLTADQSATATIKAMGRYRRPMPVFNEYGSVDEIAIGVGSDQVVPAWLTVDDTLDNGKDDGTVSRSAASDVTHMPALPHKPYEVAAYRDRRGCELAENWVVYGETHAWAGGAQSDATDTDADPLAPDVATAMYRFFTSPTTLGASARCAVR